MNRTDLATALGVSVPTISEWLSILAVTAQIFLVQPYFENFGKRLVKTPKPYSADSELACHFLGIDTEVSLRKSTFLGPVFEGLVASEIVKHQMASGHAPTLYCFCDRQGLEVDFLIPQGGEHLLLIEAKTTRIPRPRVADGMLRLGKSIPDRKISCLLVTIAADKPLAPAPLCRGCTNDTRQSSVSSVVKR